MNQSFAQLQQWFSSLAPRERILVGAGGVLVMITLLFLLIWEPLSKAHHKRESDLSSARQLATRIELLAGLARNNQAGGGGTTNRNLSLLSAVDQASKSGMLSKAPSRLQPEGDTEVKVWLEAVTFDSLVRWINELQTRYGIAVRTVEIEKDASPGLVSARLSLVRP